MAEFISNFQKDMLKKLKIYSKMLKQEDIDFFEHYVWKLAEAKNLEILSELFQLFDDSCPYSEVMYSLVHAVESYPDDFYVKIFISNIEKMLVSSKNWVQILLFAILNDEDCLEIFRANMHLAPKESLLKLFSIMEEESPHHFELIQELRRELEKS